MSEHNPSISHRPYRVVEYDPNWPALFTKYSSEIAQLLTNNLVEIHHYGSTSIPGMFAKPNIDIYVLVKSLEDVRGKQAELEKLGYVARGDYSGIGEEYFTLDTKEGERIASVHIFEGTNERFQDYENFKKYLTENEEARLRYIERKRDLYERHIDDYPRYDAGKKDLILDLIEEARHWCKD